MDADHPEKPLEDVISEMHNPETAELKDMSEDHVNKVLGIMNEISPDYVEKHGLKFAHGKHTRLTMYKVRDIYDYVMTKGDLECAFQIEAPNPVSTNELMRQDLKKKMDECEEKLKAHQSYVDSKHESSEEDNTLQLLNNVYELNEIERKRKEAQEEALKKKTPGYDVSVGNLFDQSSEEKLPDNFKPLFDSIESGERKPLINVHQVYDIESEEREVRPVDEHQMKLDVIPGGKTGCTAEAKKQLKAKIA